MNLNSERLATRLEAAVGTLEERTDAEVVVVLTASTWRGQREAVVFGALMAWLTTAFLCWSPWVFADTLIPLESALVGLLTWRVARRWPETLRRFAPTAAARAHEDAADQAFLAEGVDATRDRLGVLVFVDLAANRVTLRADHGILGRVSDAQLTRLVWDSASEDGLLASLHALGDLLAERIPATRVERDGLSNRPRVLA